MTDKEVADYVETLQRAIEQVHNRKLRENARNALTRLFPQMSEAVRRNNDDTYRDEYSLSPHAQRSA